MSLKESEIETVRQVLRDLVALERDRELGYPPGELHKDPREVLREADVALELLGGDPEFVIWEDDRERLGLERDE